MEDRFTKTFLKTCLFLKYFAIELAQENSLLSCVKNELMKKRDWVQEHVYSA